MVKREFSFPPKPSKSQIFVPPNWEEQEEIYLGLIKILLKFLNYPLNLSPLCSQPAVPIFLLSLYCSFLTLLLITRFTTSHANFFAMSLPLLSHAAANPNCEFFNCFDFIDLFTIKKFFNCFAFIVSIVFFFFLSFPCIRYAGTAYILCKLRETIM